MNQISKPHIVDLLRIFDKKRYINPRIRYASVRSKPELLNDLKLHFTIRVFDLKGKKKTERIIYFDPVIPIHRLPRIHYSVLQKKFFFDDLAVDVPAESRQRPSFQIRKEKITLYFDLPPDREAVLSI